MILGLSQILGDSIPSSSDRREEAYRGVRRTRRVLAKPHPSIRLRKLRLLGMLPSKNSPKIWDAPGDFSTVYRMGKSVYNLGKYRKGNRPMPATLNAMLVKTPDVCGGKLRIDGTRITVHRIATLYKQGQTAEDIFQTYPHLSYSQIYVALAYYHENQAQIDADLAEMDAEYDRLKNPNQP